MVSPGYNELNAIYIKDTHVSLVIPKHLTYKFNIVSLQIYAI